MAGFGIERNGARFADLAHPRMAGFGIRKIRKPGATPPLRGLGAPLLGAHRLGNGCCYDWIGMKNAILRYFQAAIRRPLAVAREVLMSLPRGACWVLVTLVLMWARAVFPGHAGTDVFLPSVGKGTGVGDAIWSTSIWVLNPNEVSANAQIFFLARNKRNLDPAVVNETLEPGETRRYDDAMFDLFGGEDFGAVRIVSDQRLLAVARVFTTPAGSSERDSTGQSFSAVPHSFAIAEGQATSIVGVFQSRPLADSDYRYNFGFVEVTGAPVTVKATALTGRGQAFGSRVFSVRAFEPQQHDISSLVGEADATNLRVRVEVVSGPGRVVVFGSGIANGSNDPSTFEMLFLEQQETPGGVETVTAGDGLTGGGSASSVVLAVGAGEGIEVTSSAVAIADGGVTQAKLSAGQGVPGTVLATDGTQLVWTNMSAITSIATTDGLEGGGSAGALTLRLADEGVTTDKISNGSVTLQKLDSTSPSRGRLLATDGDTLFWTTRLRCSAASMNDQDKVQAYVMNCVAEPENP